MDIVSIESWLEQNFAGNWRRTFDDKGVILLASTLTPEDIETLNNFHVSVLIDNNGNFVLRDPDDTPNVTTD